VSRALKTSFMKIWLLSHYSCSVIERYRRQARDTSAGNHGYHEKELVATQNSSRDKDI